MYGLNEEDCERAQEKIISITKILFEFYAGFEMQISEGIGASEEDLENIEKIADILGINIIPDVSKMV